MKIYKLKYKILTLFLASILIFSPSFVLATENDKAIDNLSEEETAEDELSAEEKYRIEFMEKAKKMEKYSINELTTAYLLGDYSSGEILEGENIDEIIAIASTTKILSIYVVLDAIRAGKLNYDDIVTITKESAILRGSSYDLKEGDRILVKDLIEAAIVVSGNDACHALAVKVSGTEDDFVKLMQEKLRDLEIYDADIINCTGLPNYNIDKQNMMSTRSLFKLSRSFIMDYPEILLISSMKEIVNEDRDYKEKTTNPLLGELLEIDGLKTGYTGMAGRCLIATGIKKADDLIFGSDSFNASRINGDDKEIIIGTAPDEEEGAPIYADTRLIGITMGSKGDVQRYVAAKKLMEHGFETYRNYILGDPNIKVETVHNEECYPKDYELYPLESKIIMKKKDDAVSFNVKTMEITPPLDAGNIAGEITYFLNGEEIFSSPLIIKENLVRTNFFIRMQRAFQKLFSNSVRVFNTN
ncbi:MAG: D-alanyl-D-alanine carboxypeptidase family protein [Tissierellia bacterium]|nr:D-alanyl-D-alanine carboxypeptidase family protein [Tissierellia bacterium]